MSWKKVKLGEILTVRDNRFKPQDKAIEGLKRIDKIDFFGEIFISDKTSNTDMILIKKGDLVISGINVEKGAMAVYTGEDDIIATIHYSSYSFDENKTDIEFLKFFLKSNEFKDALKEQVPGGIKTEIKPKHLLPLIVEIPTDIKDQREIVKLLKDRNSKIDILSTELTHQLDLVKKLRQQILQDAVQGKLVEQNIKDLPNRQADEPASELLKKIKAEKLNSPAFKGRAKEKELPPIKPEDLPAGKAGIPFEIPDNWVWCRLGEICTKITDGFHNTPPKVSEGIPYIAATQVKSDKIDWENCNYVEEKYHRELYIKAYPQKGELLVVNIGAGCGTPAIIDVDFEFSFKNTAILKFNQSLISNKLLFYYFLLRKEEIYAELTKGGLQPFLSLKILNEINFPLPPIAEQNRIVQKIEELMQYCNELEASIKQSESQNEKLLQQVLREALQPASPIAGKEPVTN